MVKRKEPDFMKELHKIRARISKKWGKMSSHEFLESLHESGRWLKSQLRESVSHSR
jgi:hypothetical protein